MRLDPELLPPSLTLFINELTSVTNLEGVQMPRPQRLAAEAPVALLGSARRPAEMEDYARRLKRILDAEALYASQGRTEERTRLMEHLSEANTYAVLVKTAKSGMACENALMSLQYALDEATDLIATAPASRKAGIPGNHDGSEL